jgi:hypothetical protein
VASASHVPQRGPTQRLSFRISNLRFRNLFAAAGRKPWFIKEKKEIDVE